MMKRVLITGGTSGIGLATAHRLAESQSAIVINGRNGERGAQARAAILARKPDANVRFIAADVSTRDGVSSLFTAAMDGFGAPINVLVNSAGGEFIPTLFHENRPEIVDSVIQRWLISTIYCCLFALPNLADGAAIVNVGSDAGKVPTPGESVIGAAMAGISMFSRTLAMEAKRRKIRVNVVTPSLVQETLTHDRIMSNPFSAKLFGKALQAAHLGPVDADDVAAAIQFLVGKDASKVTGQVLSINGGISAG
jgi:NAD(P)-dependent dehydrogenase (short-subunit alcohol dehydrogenase family)